jgi:transcription elongation factor Elf1
VDVYSNWIDACESVAKTEVDKEMREGGKANAEDLNFSSYGAERAGGAADGDDDDY